MKFTSKELKNLYFPAHDSSGEDNGQITIIGNSNLFHGPLILALKTASRFVDMVFFASPEESNKEIAAYVKSEVPSFIWVPFEEVDKYIDKSDACLIGPGFKRYNSENSENKHDVNFCDDDCKKTREVTEKLLTTHASKKWVIDAGSLQVMDADWIPQSSIITPNKKEFEMLFDSKPDEDTIREMSKKYSVTIVVKGVTTLVESPEGSVEIEGGNAGLTKGGTGDVLAGLTAALFAKNDALLSASAASFIQKKAAEELAIDVGTFYNADDLANQIPYTYNRLLS